MSTENKDNSTRNLVAGIIVLAIASGLIYYFFFREGATMSTGMTEEEAKTISKRISNLIETGSTTGLAEADTLTANLLKSGWIYLDYNSVKKATVV